LPLAAGAQLCEVGQRPGSTLLFPYFEVDLSRPDGLTTLISVNSASETPTLARVVLWTNWAVPELAFDLYLDPKDVQTINLRDVFSGRLPSTSGAGLFQFGSCPTNPPSYALTPTQVSDLVNAFSSEPDLGSGSGCPTSMRSVQHAHGYITVDTVGRCTG